MTIIESFSLGTDVIGDIYDNGDLIIHGSGPMDDQCWASPITESEHRESIVHTVIEEGITTIAHGAVFWECVNMVSIDIPDTIELIGGWAFYRCESLVSVDIPAATTVLGKPDGCGIAPTFVYGTFSLEAINVHPDNPEFSSANGMLLDKSGETLLVLPYAHESAASGVLDSTVIPETVTTIGEEAYGCESDQPSQYDHIIIPDTVTTIERHAFGGGGGMVTVDTGDGVTTIGFRAFQYRDMVSVRIGTNVEFLDEGAFWFCNEITTIHNHYDGDQDQITSGWNRTWRDAGTNVPVEDRLAYCYEANTQFIASMEEENFTVFHFPTVKTYLDAVQIEPDFTGKWPSFYTQGPRSIGASDTEDVRSATITVAASDSLHKEDADYVCDGVADHVTITEAMWGFIILDDKGNPDKYAMYDAGPPEPRRVLLLEGTYNYDNAIDNNREAYALLPPDVTVEGQGPSTVLKHPDHADSYCVMFQGVGLYYNDPQVYSGTICIRNMTFEFQKGWKMSWACWVSEVENLIIENIDTYDMHRSGIYMFPLWNVDNGVLRNCNIHNSGGEVFYINDGGMWLIENCHITMHPWYGSGGGVIWSQHGEQDLVIRGCSISTTAPDDPNEWFSSGIMVQNARSAIVENCIVNHFFDPIRVRADDLNIVRNCTLNEGRVYESGGQTWMWPAEIDAWGGIGGLSVVQGNTLLCGQVSAGPDAIVQGNVFRKTHPMEGPDRIVSISTGGLVTENDFFGTEPDIEEISSGANTGAGNRLSDGSWST